MSNVENQMSKECRKSNVERMGSVVSMSGSLAPGMGEEIAIARQLCEIFPSAAFHPWRRFEEEEIAKARKSESAKKDMGRVGGQAGN